MAPETERRVIEVTSFRPLAVVGLILSGLVSALFGLAAGAIASNEDYFGESTGPRAEIVMWLSALGVVGAVLATIGLLKRSRGAAWAGAYLQGATAAFWVVLFSSAGEVGAAVGFILVIALDVYVVRAARYFPRRPTNWAAR